MPSCSSKGCKASRSNHIKIAKEVPRNNNIGIDTLERIRRNSESNVE
jgi:hypothetical protein